MTRAWTVVVPFKRAGTRKSRLAAVLDEAAREALAARMACHVLATVGLVGDARPLLLSRVRPDWWAGAWRDDDDGPLNVAIEAARRALGPAAFAVVHADLPRLTTADVAALLAAAGDDGIAVAPDRHGTGTNAVAIAGARRFVFAFGPGSFSRHRDQGGVTVARDGLALDVDTPADLDDAGGEGPWQLR